MAYAPLAPGYPSGRSGLPAGRGAIMDEVRQPARSPPMHQSGIAPPLNRDPALDFELSRHSPKNRFALLGLRAREPA